MLSQVLAHAIGTPCITCPIEQCRRGEKTHNPRRGCGASGKKEAKTRMKYSSSIGHTISSPVC